MGLVRWFLLMNLRSCQHIWWFLSLCCLITRKIIHLMVSNFVSTTRLAREIKENSICILLSWHLNSTQNTLMLPYSLPNLDRVAVHHVAVGAMYNHSFVTYREPALLYNDQHSTVDNKQRLAVVGTWMVHHWFSYLVPIKCGHKFVAEWRFGKLMCFWAMGWLLQWCKILINFWKGT